MFVIVFRNRTIVINKGKAMKNRIGIDVGGTNVKIALVDDKGKIVYSNSVPTRAEMGYEYTVNNIKIGRAHV